MQMFNFPLENFCLQKVLKKILLNKLDQLNNTLLNFFNICINFPVL